MRHPDEIERLIRQFAKLPGLGSRSARRIVVDMLKKKHELMTPLANMMLEVAANVRSCRLCGNLDVDDTCHICADERRDKSLICVVEEVADIWAIERTAAYKGLYHVLGGALSAIAGVGPDQLNVQGLIKRIGSNDIKEVILATSSTLEGQATAHYVAESLQDPDIRITRLAQGMPIGGELDYLDEGTLGAAIKLRQLT